MVGATATAPIVRPITAIATDAGTTDMGICTAVNSAEIAVAGEINDPVYKTSYRLKKKRCLAMDTKCRHLRSNRRKNCKRRLRLHEIEQCSVREDLPEQPKTMHLDDTQLREYIDEMTQRIEWSTNRIVDESRPAYVAVRAQNSSAGGFPWLLKCTIGIPIMLVGFGILVFMWRSAGLYWIQGWSMRLALIFLGITAFDCLCLGVEIFREKDRNYIIALFSALVSLVALIVTLVK